MPVHHFNGLVRDWLSGTVRLKEHGEPAAFAGLLAMYHAAWNSLVQQGAAPKEAHRKLLSDLTKFMFGYDLRFYLQSKHKAALVNLSGFRDTLAQAVAKNTGENFVNLIVFALADLLAQQDEVLVDKGLPPLIREGLATQRSMPLPTGARLIDIKIEADLCVFSRSDPSNAILITAKTRLKEIFHISTMWKILFDMLDDPHCLAKWSLKRSQPFKTSDILYAFATADMVNTQAKGTQGGDVERATVRNLIAMDASFFDYCFVSKTGISHVSNTMLSSGPREALFHELGCIIDLIEQKFGLTLV